MVQIRMERSELKRIRRRTRDWRIAAAVGWAVAVVEAVVLVAF